MIKFDEICNKADKNIDNNINPNDEYYTPDYAIYPILKYLKPESMVWCPFDTTESNYPKLLKQNNHQVINSHIFDNQDFFNYLPDNFNEIDYIISNPPYSFKNEVLERLFYLNKPFAMLLGVVGIFESQKRFNMFKNNDLEVMYFNKRVSYLKSYSDVKPTSNPPFSSVYICKNFLPKQIVFEEINK